MFFLTLTMTNFSSKMTHDASRKELLSPRQVDFLLTTFSKPRQHFSDSVVRSNLLMIECKTPRFGLLRPTKNPSCSSQVLPEICEKKLDVC